MKALHVVGFLEIGMAIVAAGLNPGSVQAFAAVSRGREPISSAIYNGQSEKPRVFGQQAMMRRSSDKNDLREFGERGTQDLKKLSSLRKMLEHSDSFAESSLNAFEASAASAKELAQISGSDDRESVAESSIIMNSRRHFQSASEESLGKANLVLRTSRYDGSVKSLAQPNILNYRRKSDSILDEYSRQPSIVLPTRQRFHPRDEMIQESDLEVPASLERSNIVLDQQRQAGSSSEGSHAQANIVLNHRRQSQPNAEESPLGLGIVVHPRRRSTKSASKRTVTQPGSTLQDIWSDSAASTQKSVAQPGIVLSKSE